MGHKDHASRAVQLVSARVNGFEAMAGKAQDLGLTNVCQADKDTRETMFARAGIVIHLAVKLADATGRIVQQVISDLEFEILQSHHDGP